MKRDFFCKHLLSNLGYFFGINDILDFVNKSRRISVKNSSIKKDEEGETFFDMIKFSGEVVINKYLLNLFESIDEYSYSDFKFNKDSQSLKNVMNYKNDYFFWFRKGELGLAKYIYYNDNKIGVVKCEGFDLHKGFIFEKCVFDWFSLEDLNVDLDLFDSVIKKIDNVLFRKKIYISKKNGFIEYKSLDICSMYVCMSKYCVDNFHYKSLISDELYRLFDYVFFDLNNIYNVANDVFLREDFYLLECSDEYISKVLEKKEVFIDFIGFMKRKMSVLNQEMKAAINTLNGINDSVCCEESSGEFKCSEVKQVRDMVDEVNIYSERISVYTNKIEFIEYYCSLVETISDELICHRFLAVKS